MSNFICYVYPTNIIFLSGALRLLRETQEHLNEHLNLGEFLFLWVTKMDFIFEENIAEVP